MSENVIRASEIGEYVYCHRAWWLKRVGGRQSSYVRELKAGRDYHAAHGRLVQRSKRVRQAAIAIFLLAAMVFIYFFLQAA